MADDDDMEDAGFEDAEMTDDADDEEREAAAVDAEEDEDDLAIEDDEVVDAPVAVADEQEDEEAEAVVADEPEVVARPRATAARADSSVVHSVAAKEEARKRLAADVEAFLKRGGSIETVPQDVRADPPKKPESNYGRGSI